MLDSMGVRTVVHREIRDLLVESGGDDTAVNDHDQLYELGLNSLMLARLIIQLESEFGIDPFAAEDVVITDIRSVDDLAAIYQLALAGTVEGRPAPLSRTQAPERIGLRS